MQGLRETLINLRFLSTQAQERDASDEKTSEASRFLI